ncbi:hypothetical protein WN944_023023 [Citrus x changshan-huyou]|uniref:Uncharacterized protein n=1 Tax=Citrus x changshan-huyou TaxID=2935761 RepID=A0AAP0R3I2_9ROSI
MALVYVTSSAQSTPTLHDNTIPHTIEELQDVRSSVVSWLKIPWDGKEWFNLDLYQMHVLCYLNKIMGKRYVDYRYKTLSKASK